MDSAGMEQYVEMGVKPLIETFPEVGEILDRYGVGCVACTVGTCKLGDVIKFHGLLPQDQTEMMSQIKGAIYSTRDAPQKTQTVTELPRPAEIVYHLPVQRLVDEHGWIKRLLIFVPNVVNETRATGEIETDLLLTAVDFIRGYADRFHHMKEEDILFDYTDREAEIVQVIIQDHDRARGYVRAIVRAVDDGDSSALCDNLIAYRELLSEHIAKEDEILYPYIDRGLTSAQVDEIGRRFEEVESSLADDIPQRYEQFIISLTSRFEREEALQ